MRGYEIIDRTDGVFAKAESVGKFNIYADESYIYFNRKHYTVIETIKEAEGTIYKTECLRHNGKRHIKYETVFVDSGKWVGYTEALLIESI